MAKVAKVIGIVAGAVAIVATGGALLGPALGLISATTAATLTTIATVASVVAGVANLGYGILSSSRAPPAQGSVSRILVETNAGRPCVLGRCYTGGVLRHDTGYGATLDDVPNPYRGMVIVYSGCGPNKSITPKVDYGAIGSYYSGFLYTATQLGACPEAGALTPHFSGMPNWGSGYKLSGHAAILWNAKFDGEGNVFSGGLPLLGAVVEGCRCYDPRKDSTYPGGSGSHRLATPSTWEYSTNPALHAGRYAYGEYQNGKLVFGIGMSASSVIWSDVAAWANVCQANGWTIGGVIVEGGEGADVQQQRWSNLQEICRAGGGEPVFANGMLGFYYSAPKVVLDTITDADILGDDASVTTTQPWRDRLNTVVPQYRSESHNWEIVSAEKVAVSTYLADDGEEKIETYPFNLVTDKDQAAELATYKIVDGREFAPVSLKTGPRLRGYRPGDCLAVESDTMDLFMPCVVRNRTFSPADLTVALEMVTETDEKHDYALGLTAVPPPTPVLQMAADERDDTLAATRGIEKTNLIYKKAATKPSTPAASPGVPSGWFDEAASATGGDLPLWECYGIKLAGAANFVWQSVVAAVIDTRIWDGIDTGGTIKDGNVGTGAIVGGAIASPSVAFGSDAFVAGASSADGSIVTLYTTGWITIGDAVDGQALIQGGAWADGQEADVGARLYLDVDTGSGFAEAARNECGARTSGGDTYMRGNMNAMTTVSGTDEVRVRIRAQSIRMGGASNSFDFYARDPVVAVFGSAR